MPVTGRTDALDRAKERIQRKTGENGEPEDNFSRIARMWSAYLGVDIEPHQVADMMVQLKLCRIASGHPDPDHWIDMVGYAGLSAHLAARETSNE